MNQLLNDYKLLFIYNQYNVMKCMSTVGCKIPRLAVCTSVCVYVCVCVCVCVVTETYLVGLEFNTIHSLYSVTLGGGGGVQNCPFVEHS